MNKCKTNIRIISSELGISDMVVAAATLPIALMLIAAVVDLTRVPIANDRVSEALRSASFNTENFVKRKGAQGVEGYDLLYDDFTPAANSICDDTGGVALCNSSLPSGKSGFLTTEVSQALVDSACELAASDLQYGASGLFNYLYTTGEGNLGSQYSLIKLIVSSEGVVTGVSVIATSANTCGGNFSNFVPDPNSKFSPITLATTLKSRFSSAGAGAGPWFIQDQFDAEGAQNWVTTRTPWLPSYWLIGVAYVKVEHFFGTFFGESHTVIDYFVRPFNAPAGIEKPVDDGGVGGGQSGIT